MKTDSLKPTVLVSISTIATLFVAALSWALPPPPPAEPKTFELVAYTDDVVQRQDSFTVYFDTASVLGNVTNAWVARTNMPGSHTNVFIVEGADFMIYKYAVSNATYGRVEFPDQVVAKEAAPAPRVFSIHYRPDL